MACITASGSNPRPRVGGDQISLTDNISYIVSIHAPVWGATGENAYQSSVIIVSIHAPVWGATHNRGFFTDNQRSCFNPRPRVGGDRGRRSIRGILDCFNPRPRVGGDSIIGTFLAQAAQVSIHAPVWGATRGQRLCRYIIICFNPRPRVGGDPLQLV